MINITKTVTVNQGVAPFEFVWENVNSNSCLSMSPSQGTSTDGVITTEATFTDTNCIANSPVTLTVTDAQGCVNTFDIDFANPCQFFTASDIQHTNPYTFSTLASGGTAPYSYTWSYDSTYFTRTVTNPSILNLTLTTPFNGEMFTNVSVVVKDDYGCSITKYFTLNFCASELTNTYVALYCSSINNEAHRTHVLLDIEACVNSPIVWSTLSFAGFPAGITITKDNYLNEPNAIDISANLNLITPGTYNGTYSVQNEYGIWTTAQLTVHVPDCSDTSAIYGIETCVHVDCPAVLGWEYTIDLDDYVSSSYPVDWSTFQWYPIVGQAVDVNNPLLLHGIMGDYLVDIDHKMTFTLNSANQPFETVNWAVSNVNGDSTGLVCITFILNCLEPPMAFADNFCAVCCQATPYLDILANDTPPYDPTTVTIVTPPSHGSVIVDPVDGTISYTPDCDFSGTDMLTYYVCDSIGGNCSNNAVVTFDVICAGTSTTYTACS